MTAHQLQTWQGKPLPRVVIKRPTFKNQANYIPLEVAAVRFTKEQLEVIDRLAYGLRVSRSEFLRNFFVHMLNLPIDGKCCGDDIWGKE
jgi:hypothetical protein